VRISSGPFGETLCRIAHLDDRGRVRVLLEVMRMEVAAQLERSAIARQLRNPNRQTRFVNIDSCPNDTAVAASNPTSCLLKSNVTIVVDLIG
jgi:hypothetical protein